MIILNFKSVQRNCNYLEIWSQGPTLLNRKKCILIEWCDNSLQRCLIENWFKLNCPCFRTCSIATITRILYYISNSSYIGWYYNFYELVSIFGGTKIKLSMKILTNKHWEMLRYSLILKEFYWLNPIFITEPILKARESQDDISNLSNHQILSFCLRHLFLCKILFCFMCFYVFWFVSHWVIYYS